MSYLETNDLDSFISAAKKAGIQSVVLAWQQEWGQVPEQATVEYRPLRLAWLLAYDTSCGHIIRWRCDGEDRVKLRETLIANGLRVEERSRNLTQFGNT